VTGSTDPGLVIIEGKVNKEFSLEQAEARLNEEIQRLQESGFDADEVQKVKNQSETALAGADVELLNKAINLAYFTLLGEPDGFEEELKKVEKVTKGEIEDTFRRLIVSERSNTLLYKAIPQDDEAED
jgi:zinc protease